MNKTFFILSMLLVLAATTAQAQFSYTTNNAAVTITGSENREGTKIECFIHLIEQND